MEKLAEPNHAGILIADFLASRIVLSMFLLFISSVVLFVYGLWYSVMGSQMNYDGSH